MGSGDARGARLTRRARRRVARAALPALLALPGPAISAGATGITVGPVTVPVAPGPVTAPYAPYAPPPAPAPRPRPGPFDRRGMWIWYVSRSEGGNAARIVARARRNGVGTVFVKAGDGANVWGQFSPALVRALHRHGLEVCAWQYVYGTHPLAEARVGARALAVGADCLAIDAETEYEGRYVSAQSYLGELRRRVGARFPVALAGYPYIDDHPGFPYSVFLGPGGAQVDAPQMYWRDIGVAVDAVYAHTYLFNRVYGRPIRPLGEVAGHPPATDIVRFRQVAAASGAPGVSWWDWQESSDASWRALSRPVARLAGYTPEQDAATLGRGARGDLVVWAQEHLRAAGYRIAVDGVFGAETESAVGAFQAATGLVVTDLVDLPTWQALLRRPAAAVRWTTGRGGRGNLAHPAAVDGALTLPVPRTAGLRARADELHGAPGRG